MTSLRAVVIRPGRSAYGEIRRTQTWIKLFRASGGDATDMGFLRAGAIRPALHLLPRLSRGEVVPESIVWDARMVKRRLEAIRPDVVVLQTARSYQPELLDGPWVTVLDLVDRLSVSYFQRARLSLGLRSRAFRHLAQAHEVFEEWAADNIDRVVTAGRSDAEHLDATWIPNLIDPTSRPRPGRSKPYDVVFFGSLGYRPNVEALEWLAQANPSANQLRVLVAGHAPSDEVRHLCRSRGWTLVEDYPSNDWLAEQATVALAPLRSTAGIQNKVLEAATMGLPQVVAPPALCGLQEGFPAVVADSPEEFVRSVRELVADTGRCDRMAEDAWAYAHAHYTTDAWVPDLWRLTANEMVSEPRWSNSPERVDFRDRV